MALTVAACGETGGEESAQGFTGEKQRIAQVIESYEDAWNQRDAERVCDMIYLSFAPGATPAYRRLNAAERRSCPRTVRKGFDKVGEIELTVDKVALSGQRATATVTSRGTKKEKVEMPLRSFDGRWLVGFQAD